MIYLDNAATSWPKAPGCAEAVAETLMKPMGNPGRTSHSAGIQADRILFELREHLAKYFSITDSSGILFTSGTTESLNTVLYGHLREGDLVITGPMEHNAVMRPLNDLSELRNIRIKRLPGDQNTGAIDLKVLEGWLREEAPQLIVMTGASNVNGLIFPVEEICHLARKKGIPVCIDAAQAAGETELLPEKWGIDFLCLSGHKGLLAPAGTGALYIQDPERLPPLKRGGTGSRSSEEIQPDWVPDKFESGTPNIPGLAGWLHSMTYLKDNPRSRGRSGAFESLISGLRELPDLRIIGHPPNRSDLSFTPVVSVIPERSSLTELTGYLNDHQIAVRSGLQCAPGAHKTLGTFEGGGTIRFSPGEFTTSHEISTVIDVLKRFLKR